MFSIIIPTYNRAHLLSRTIESVLAQTYSEWELIIVDDRSTDNTKKITLPYLEDKRIKFIIRDEKMPKGANTCRNIGIKESQGENLIFLDSDDELLSDCLKKRETFMRQYELTYDAYIFSHKNQPLLIKGTLDLYKDTNIRDLYICHFLRFKFPWQITDTIWKRESILTLTGFDPNLQRFQDVDMHIRALLNKNFKMLLTHGGSPEFKRNKESNKYFYSEFIVKAIESYKQFFNKYKKLLKQPRHLRSLNKSNAFLLKNLLWLRSQDCEEYNYCKTILFNYLPFKSRLLFILMLLISTSIKIDSLTKFKNRIISKLCTFC